MKKSYKMTPERCQPTSQSNNYEANWIRQIDDQDHVLSQADTLTKNKDEDRKRNFQCIKFDFIDKEEKDHEIKD